MPPLSYKQSRGIAPLCRCWVQRWQEQALKKNPYMTACSHGWEGIPDCEGTLFQLVAGGLSTRERTSCRPLGPSQPKNHKYMTL